MRREYRRRGLAGWFHGQRHGTEDASQVARVGGREPGRRFGDLFNLVYDPAFLAAAWDRVAANKGA